ncbi:TPA: hypothetical protein ACQKY2_000644 [Enterococcus faecium]
MKNLLNREFLFELSITFLMTLICVMEPMVVFSEDVQSYSSSSDYLLQKKRG